jgi:hypothetical protein
MEDHGKNDRPIARHRWLAVAVSIVGALAFLAVWALSASGESATAPTNTGRPIISGVAQDGQTLTTTDGTWSGTAPITYTYQWRRCAGTTCSPITGAKNPTYALTHDDVGWSMRVVVTATNSAGSSATSSAPTTVVAAAPPTATTPPAISGTAMEGQTLSTTDGTWSGTPPLALAYQWLRCGSAGDGCDPIVGATATTYMLTSADVGATVRAQVTATNAAGSQAASSDATAVVIPIPAAPVASAPPVVSGTLRDGQTLTTTNGTWSGTPPIGYAYQWLRCDSTGANCNAVPGATQATYPLTPADVGSTLRAQVIASNAGGSASSISAVTGRVSAVAPAMLTLPVVSGDARVDQTLTTTNGTWSGTPPLTYAYQWRRCDAAGDNCVSIAGATAATYTVTAADVGATIRARVTAKNAAGSAYRSSAQTSPVSAVSSPCGTASSPPAGGWQHVVWIVFENKQYGDVIGSPNAPYINSVADECGLATNFAAETHPSLPNYIAMTSGDTQGVTDDKGPSAHLLDAPSIFSQLGPTGWKSLEESMPANCALSDTGNYVARHNPAVYYANARGDCGTQDIPLGATPDLSARFTFVTPDICHDMHTSPCANDTASEVAAGDAWLAQFLPKVFSSPEYQAGGTAVFITWDEDDDGGTTQHIPTIVASPSTPAGTTSSTAYDHYSLLRTTEELLGLGTLLGKSKTATSMGPAFNLPANPIIDLGYRDPGYRKAQIPTADKPQSKLWFQDGTWWGLLSNPATGATQIYRLDRATQAWINTGTTVDTRASARGDALWDGNKLYVVSGTTVVSEWGQPPDPAAVAAGSAQLSRFSYDPTTQTYSLDPGFPVTVHTGSTESITLAKDSTGELWVTYTQVAPDNSNQVYVNHSVGGDDVWGTPIPLPTPAAAVNYDDISSIIAFGGNKIGIMWSNQDAKKFYFAVHADGDPDTAWQTEVAYGGGVAGCTGGCANDHISLKTDNGLIYAGVKTAAKNNGQPFVVLLVRDTQGHWTSNVFGTVEELHTRPLVLIDDEHRELYLFAVLPEVGGSIYYKATSLDNISFAPGQGTLLLKSSGDADISNPTSTKQNLNSATGLVVLASANMNGHYWHNYLSLDGPPPATP